MEIFNQVNLMVKSSTFLGKLQTAKESLVYIRNDGNSAYIFILTSDFTFSINYHTGQNIFVELVFDG